jgi:hypothetical protein
MTDFIETADARKTSPELMEAIFRVAGRSPIAAEFIWEMGPTEDELCAIVEIVTNNGMYETTDFCWGVSGSNWATA